MAVPQLPSGGQDLGQFLEPGPQVSEPSGDVHGGEAFHFAAAFQFVREVDHRSFAEGPQRLPVGGREVDEPGYQRTVRELMPVLSLCDQADLWRYGWLAGLAVL